MQLRTAWAAAVIAALGSGSFACDTEEDTRASACPTAVSVEPCGACIAAQCAADSAACYGGDWRSGTFAGACQALLECACGENAQTACDDARTAECAQCETTFSECQSSLCAAECASGSGGVGAFGSGFGGSGAVGGSGGFGGGLGGLGGAAGSFATGGLGGLGGTGGFGGTVGSGGTVGFGGSGGDLGFGGSAGLGGTLGSGGVGGTLSCAPSGSYCIGDGECCSSFCNVSICS